ncbi:DUF1456 family protein [Shigella boydii]
MSRAAAEQIAVWLRKEDEEGFQHYPDVFCESFLNGLIMERGKDGLLRHWSRNVELITTSCRKNYALRFSLKPMTCGDPHQQRFRVSMPELQR